MDNILIAYFQQSMSHSHFAYLVFVLFEVSDLIMNFINLF